MLVWEEDMVRALRKERESLCEENARLTQRVEELERQQGTLVKLGQFIGDKLDDTWKERAEAAEAKLARVVEILSNPDGLDTRWETMQKALTAAKGEDDQCS